MDNLQHIDDLLKRASQEPANALVNDTDWDVIEKKLKRRKTRIYAMWVFLALVVSSSVLQINSAINEKSTTKTITDLAGQTDPLDSSPLKELDQENIDNTKSKEDIIAQDNLLRKVKTEKKETFKPSIIKDTSHTIDPLTNSISLSDISINHTLNTIKSTINYTLQQILPNVKSDKLAQNLNTSNINDSRYFEIGYSFTPSFSSTILNENPSRSGLIHMHYYDRVRSSESSAFSSSNGINIQLHNTNSKWFLGTGLSLTQRNEYVNYDYKITRAPSINDGNTRIDTYFPIPPKHITYQGSNSYHFVEIPLNIGYKQPISRKFELRTQLGISYLSLINTSGKKGDVTYMTLEDLSDLQLRSNNISTNFRSGLYYNTSRLSVGVEPLLSVNVTPLTDKVNSPIYVRPYSYGLNVSTNFKLFNQ